MPITHVVPLKIYEQRLRRVAFRDPLETSWRGLPDLPGGFLARGAMHSPSGRTFTPIISRVIALLMFEKCPLRNLKSIQKEQAERHPNLEVNFDERGSRTTGPNISTCAVGFQARSALEYALRFVFPTGRLIEVSEWKTA